MSNPPAHETKHIQSLIYHHLGQTFHLTQSDDGHNNGTTLWLSAQILSLYIYYHLKPPVGKRPRAVELGSGVGLAALVLGALGYDVVATDTQHVCNSVLRHNIAANLPHVQVRELDWNVESDQWRWDDPMRITPTGDAPTKCGANAEQLLGPPFDIILSSDTLYDVSLVQPFFRTVRALAASSREIDPLKPILLLLALERRDPQLIASALASAPVPLTRVPMNKIRRAIARGGLGWDTADWDGVEIWRGTLHGM